MRYPSKRETRERLTRAIRHLAFACAELAPLAAVDRRYEIARRAFGVAIDALASMVPLDDDKRAA